MTAGGYKLVSFSWAGGRTDSAEDRVQYILYNFCKAIVDANVGWKWNDDFHDTDPAYIATASKPMGGNSSTYPNRAYALWNDTGDTTYHLIIGLNYYNQCGLREQDCLKTYYATSASNVGYTFPGCLYIGMQKGGAITYDSTYGLMPDSNNPGQWLKWMPFAFYKNDPEDSFAKRNDSGVLYTYYALIKGYQLGFFEKSSSWSYRNCLKGLLCGEIFSNTAHSSDTNTFGSIYLGGMYIYPEYQQIFSSSEGILSNSDRSSGIGVLFNYNASSSYYVYNNTASQIYKADGTLLGGYNPVSQERVQLQYDPYQVYNWACNTILSPGGRWTPCYVYYATPDQATNGVVPGDSFKGFLDTDLIRGVNPQTAYGEVLDTNGEFLHIGGGFAIGWDANNTESFF